MEVMQLSNTLRENEMIRKILRKLMKREQKILEGYCKPAILLHRPIRPEPSKTRSKLGGLPNLPKSHAWPVGLPAEGGNQRLPLHFIAQIDCGELPAQENPLPTQGMLFFFARLDDYLVFEDPSPDESSRVIYITTVSSDTPEREMPDTLPMVNSEISFMQDSMKHIDNPHHGRVLASWPVTPMLIDSYPDWSILSEAIDDENLDDWAWEDAIFYLRKKAIEKSIGRPRLLTEFKESDRSIFDEENDLILTNGIAADIASLVIFLTEDFIDTREAGQKGWISNSSQIFQIQRQIALDLLP